MKLNQIAENIAYKLGGQFNQTLKESIKDTLIVYRAKYIRDDLARNSISYHDFVQIFTLKTVGGQTLLGSGDVNQVQNSLASSTTLAPSVDAVNTGLATKWQIGGNAIGVLSRLGSTDAFDVRLIRGDVVVAALLAGGNFGIESRLVSSGSANRFTLQMPGTDTSAPAIISRNVANNVTALRVNQSNAGSTGDIIDFAMGGTVMSGVRVDGRNYGSNATATNDYITLGQLNTAGITRRGTFAMTSDNSTVINIPHGLGSVPAYAHAVANNLRTTTPYYIEVDATNIIMHFTTGTAAGLALAWLWVVVSA